MKEKFLRLLAIAVKWRCIYIWGAQGEKVTSMTDEDIIHKEQSLDDAYRVIKLIKCLKELKLFNNKCRAFDCSGLICYCLVKCGREKAGFDMTADNLYNRYPKVASLHEGVLLHRKGHIAVYVGNSHLIEAKGRDYGVVLSPYKASEWDVKFADPWAV